MGMDRGSRNGGHGGGQSGYRRDYQTNGHRSGYGKDSDNSYADHGAGGGGGRDGYHGQNADTNSKYDHGGKYEQFENGKSGHNDRSRENGARRNGAGGDENGHATQRSGGGGNTTHNGNSNNGDMLPQEMIASLEQKMASVHADMSQALNDITGKENEKFDLIFGILIELQRRQASLEDSVRLLQSQLPNPGGMQQPLPPQGQQPVPPQGQTQPAQGQAQSSNGQQQAPNQFGGNAQTFVPQMGNQMNGQMNNQGGNQGQMGNQANGQMFMTNQMNMGQQYGNMVAADGSQAFYGNVPANVVLVAAPAGSMPPQGMQAMPQGMQQMGQMMMQPMPQMMSGQMQPQMAMQFVSQDQSANGFQWGTAGALEGQQSSEVAQAGGQSGENSVGQVSPVSEHAVAGDKPQVMQEEE